jgi:hypothetical protein
MPEMNQLKKLSSWSLEDAREVGHILVVRCGLCNTTRRFLPDDILKLRKNTTITRLKFICLKCNKRDYMDVTVYLPLMSEIGKLHVRRLAGVKDVKMPVWRDETL